jgi:DnaJ-class molecular chaperone
LRDVARDDFAQERQAHEEEVRLHRQLAQEYCDAAYHSLAMKLHPDHGGTKEAMTRLNRVHHELKAIAKARRFV